MFSDVSKNTTFCRKRLRDQNRQGGTTSFPEQTQAKKAKGRLHMSFPRTSATACMDEDSACILLIPAKGHLLIKKTHCTQLCLIIINVLILSLGKINSTFLPPARFCTFKLVHSNCPGCLAGGVPHGSSSHSLLCSKSKSGSHSCSKLSYSYPIKP